MNINGPAPPEIPMPKQKKKQKVAVGGTNQRIVQLSALDGVTEPGEAFVGKKKHVAAGHVLCFSKGKATVSVN